LYQVILKEIGQTYAKGVHRKTILTKV